MFAPAVDLEPGARLLATLLAGAAGLVASGLHARGLAFQEARATGRLASNVRDAANLGAVAVLSLALAIAGLDRPLAFLSSATVLICAELARTLRVPKPVVAGFTLVASASIVLNASRWTSALSAVALRALGLHG